MAYDIKQHLPKKHQNSDRPDTGTVRSRKPIGILHPKHHRIKQSIDFGINLAKRQNSEDRIISQLEKCVLSKALLATVHEISE